MARASIRSLTTSQLFGLMDKGRGDLCCTTVSIDLWTIDLLRPSNHKILLDAGDSATFSSIFLAWSFFCSQTESTPARAPVTRAVGLHFREGK